MMLSVKIETKFGDHNTRNELHIGTAKFEVTRSQLEKLQLVIATYLAMADIPDRIIDVSI